MWLGYFVKWMDGTSEGYACSVRLMSKTNGLQDKLKALFRWGSAFYVRYAYTESLAVIKSSAFKRRLLSNL